MFIIPLIVPKFAVMAFLRRENKRGQTYLSICESFRDEAGNVNRRTLHNLGNIKNYTTEALERIGLQLIELVKGPSGDPQPIKELSRHNYGFPLIAFQLLKIFELDILMNRFKRKHKLSFSLLQPLLLMLCDRLNDPLSKLGSYNLQNEYFGLGEAVQLQHLYRTLDYLAENNQTIQTHIFNRNSNLFNYELDVVFYDVTTFYFDSDVVIDGDYRQKGYGKDGKIGKTQVLFSLLIDKNKVPIGFDVYKGSQYEGHTFENAIIKLKNRYNIKRVIVVADSGMLNNANLDLFGPHSTGNEYEYIVGDRLKTLPATVIEYLTNSKNYTTVRIKDQTAKEKSTEGSEDENDEIAFIKYTTYDYKGRTIICTWSAKRAKKDKAEREEKIKKAQLWLKKPDALEKKSKRFYIKTIDEKKYELDTDKIKWEEQFDGFKAIATNAAGITPQVALEKYKDLYKIEQSFRTFKSYLETRPMFHWTDSRIEGHLVVCYIAFCLLNYLQTRPGVGLSENEIRRVLNRMQLSKIQREEEISWLRSAKANEEDKILKSLNLKQIPDVISEKAISNYIHINM